MPNPPVVRSTLDLIGRTPVLELTRLRAEGAGSVFAKLEVVNPGGSVKDRIALGMVEAAEREGRLRPGGTIVEPTAGNTGIGLALVGRLKGYRVVVVVPEGFSREKIAVMEVLGAELIRTPKALGMKEAIRIAKEFEASNEGAYCPQQFANPGNPEIHYRTTGAELWEQMEGRVDAVCVGAGTGGTFTGVVRYLKEQDPKVRAVLVEPQGSVFGGGAAGDHKVEGIGNSFIPATLDMDLADQVVRIDDDEAFDVVKRLAAQEGVLAGGSGGAAVAAALRAARSLGPGSRVATIVPDGFERYLSKWEG